MLQGVVGPLIAGVATYGLRKELSWAILAAISTLCLVMQMQVL